jgi:hypothetical protein
MAQAPVARGIPHLILSGDAPIKASSVGLENMENIQMTETKQLNQILWSLHKITDRPAEPRPVCTLATKICNHKRTVALQNRKGQFLLTAQHLGTGQPLTVNELLTAALDWIYA